MDIVAIESPRDGETNSLCRGRKAAITKRSPRAVLVLGHEERGWGAVIERFGFVFDRHSNVYSHAFRVELGPE